MAHRTTVRLAWWNTGLAPNGESRGNVERYSTAASVLESLFATERADLLALGEVTPDDVEGCRTASKGQELSRRRWRTPRGGGGRGAAIAVAYNPNKLTYLTDELIIDSWAGSTFITGWHLAFETHAKGDALNVVVVHWPSHRFEDSARKRKWIAASLHAKFRADRDVILLGDFNDEPFSESLSDGLIAYRDRELVRRKGEAYYNPFWRFLGEQQHLEEERATALPAGTHYYKSGASSRWFTFDQVVVSSALLQKNAWRFLESTTRVVRHAALISSRGTMEDVFDHLPIATSLKYIPEDVDD